MAKSTIKMTRTTILAEAFKVVWKSGSVETMVLDMGWGEQLAIYALYGKT